LSLEAILTLAVSAAVGLIALATLIKACLEYLRNGRQSRAEMFFGLRQQLKEDQLGVLPS
jgi:hypothetical protein